MSSDSHPWLSSCLATRVGRVKPRPLQALTAHYAKHWWQLWAGEHSVDLDGKKCMDLNEDELTLRKVGGRNVSFGQMRLELLCIIFFIRQFSLSSCSALLHFLLFSAVAGGARQPVTGAMFAVQPAGRNWTIPRLPER